MQVVRPCCGGGIEGQARAARAPPPSSPRSGSRRSRRPGSPCGRAGERGRPRCARPARLAPGSGPQSTRRPWTIQNASKRSFTGCRASTSRGSAWVARSIPSSRSTTHASRSLRRSSAAARSKRCAVGGLAHPPVELLDQRLARARLLEMAQRQIELAPVGVRVEVAQAGRHAPAHLPVRRRVLADLQLAPAVAQPVHRGELVGQLRGERAAPERPDVHRVPRRPARRPPRAPGYGMSSRQRR